MSTECCKAGLKNFGRGDCTTQIDVVIGAVVVSKYDSTNTLNRIQLNSPFNASTLTALVTTSNKQNRWVKAPELTAVTMPTAETVFDESTDGSKSFVRDGKWSFASEIRDASAVPAMLKKLKSLRCKNVAVYLITRSNQLVGRKITGDDDNLYPIDLNSSSVDGLMMFRTDSETNKIMFAFDFARTMQPADLSLLDGNDLGVDFVGMRQLTDVNFVQTAVNPNTTTTVTVGLRTDFAQGLNPNYDVLGLTASSFTLFNKTSNTLVTITTVVESSSIDGQYLITFPAQVTSDEMELSLNLANYYDGLLEFLAL